MCMYIKLFTFQHVKMGVYCVYLLLLYRRVMRAVDSNIQSAYCCRCNIEEH